MFKIKLGGGRTAEVEDVRVVGNTFQGVVVAEIKECVEHPNSDHLHILKVHFVFLFQLNIYLQL